MTITKINSNLAIIFSITTALTKKPMTPMELVASTKLSPATIRRYLEILFKESKVFIKTYKKSDLGGYRPVYVLGSGASAKNPRGIVADAINYPLLEKLILKKLPATSRELASHIDVNEKAVLRSIRKLQAEEIIETKEYGSRIPAVHHLKGKAPALPPSVAVNKHSNIQCIPWQGYNQSPQTGEFKTTWRHVSQQH